MAGLLHIEDVDSFRDARNIAPEDIKQSHLATVRGLDEPHELEPMLRAILFDTGDTPHGPMEIADVFTHKVVLGGQPTLAAFILKGKSFASVKHHDVAHQIYRLEKIPEIGLAGFIFVGSVQDIARDQFAQTAERLAIPYLFADAGDIARLLVAYGFLCPRDGRRIVAGRCQCGYAPSSRRLNFLQEAALESLNTAHALRQAGGLLVLPPGAGKTRVAAQDAHRRGACILYLGHTHEILDVAEEELSAIFGVTDVRRHSTQTSLRHLARVNIASVQLADRSNASLRKVDYVVVDEFHHAAAASYRRLLRRLAHAFILGLTATPFRSDRQDILELCGGNLLVRFELRSGIETGVLAPYRYYGCFDDVDYSNIRHNGVRYDVRDLERRLSIPERDTAIVNKWRELADGKATIAFCVSLRHAERVAARFRSDGVNAAVYSGELPIPERRRIVADVHAGRTSVVCAVDVLSEGADLPFVECIMFLRPTESRRLFYQQLGRGLRRYAGKTHCVVIDFIGNFRNAYQVLDYQTLHPSEQPADPAHGTSRSGKAWLDLPLGCEVTLDSRVIDLFAEQALDPRYATRHTITGILVHQFDRLAARLGRTPTARDVDRNCLLDSSLYRLVFGSWNRFMGQYPGQRADAPVRSH